MQCEEIGMSLRVLRSHGWNITALPREFGLNWRTVKREVESGEPRHYPERAKPTALTPAQLAHGQLRLEVCPGIRGTIVHGELEVDYGYQGSYPTFARQMRRLRPALVVDPQIRFETAPRSPGAGGLGSPGAVAAGREAGLAVQDGGHPGIHP